MDKKNIVIAVVVVLVILGIGFWFNKTKGNNDYSVVYLKTGEVYVGKLTTFPDLQLKNAYVLLVTKDETDPDKTNFQLNPVDESIWALKSMHLIKDNVVFYGSLVSNSEIAKTLAEKGKN